MAIRRSKGEGTIFREKSSGLWCATIILPDGRQKRKRSKVQHVVREWLLEQRQIRQNNLPVKDERITVEDYLSQFMVEVASATLAPATIRSYGYLIRDHVNPHIGHIRLVNLHPDHLQNLYSSKLNAGLSKRTVQYIHAVIRRAFNLAVKRGLLFRNPANAVTPPRPRKKPPETLTVEQVKSLLEAAEGHPYHPIYLMAVTTGMRKGELLGLQWEDVNLEQRTLSIRHTLVEIQGRTHLGQPKSKSAKRTITIPEYVCSVLEEIRRDDGYVFRTSSGGPLSQRNLTRHLHKTLDEADLPKTSFHSLRHTAATILLQANVHPKLVQELLGHSSVSLTLDTYSHIIPGHHSEAIEEMDRIFN